MTKELKQIMKERYQKQVLTFLSAVLFQRVGKTSTLYENLSKNSIFDLNVFTLILPFIKDQTQVVSLDEFKELDFSKISNDIELIITEKDLPNKAVYDQESKVVLGKIKEFNRVLPNKEITLSLRRQGYEHLDPINGHVISKVLKDIKAKQIKVLGFFDYDNAIGCDSKGEDVLYYFSDMEVLNQCGGPISNMLTIGDDSEDNLDTMLILAKKKKLSVSCFQYKNECLNVKHFFDELINIKGKFNIKVIELCEGYLNECYKYNKSNGVNDILKAFKSFGKELNQKGVIEISLEMPFDSFVNSLEKEVLQDASNQGFDISITLLLPKKGLTQEEKKQCYTKLEDLSNGLNIKHLSAYQPSDKSFQYIPVAFTSERNVSSGKRGEKRKLENGEESIEKKQKTVGETLTNTSAKKGKTSKMEKK